MTDRLRTLADELPARVAAAAELADDERSKALRKVVRHVHLEVMRATGDDGNAPVDDLRAVATALRTALPGSIEDELSPRERIFIRLLRRDAFEPAWTLAGDNASGVVARGTGGTSMWGGPTMARTQLALPTFVEGDAVHAWLPGFRDPRWAIPDDVFDLHADVTLAARLDRVRFDRDQLHLSGTAQLTWLEARPDDTVEIVLNEAEGTRIRVPATRTRTPEYVEDVGPGLTRTAWTGWRVAVDLDALAQQPGNWRVRLEVAQDGVRRGDPVGLDRGPLAHQRLIAEPHEARSCFARVRQGGRGGVVLQVRPIESTAARVLPVGARAVLRRVRPQAVAPPEW